MASAIEKELPASFAEGLRYFDEVLLSDEAWFQTHEGKHVAILDSTVIDEDTDPHRLATRIREQHPETVLYMPHVVRLPEPLPIPPVSRWRPTLPSHWPQAVQYYREILRKDPSWLQEHQENSKRRVAIIGRQVVGEAGFFSDLSRTVRPIYGDGPIFMPVVTKEDW